VQRVVEEVIQLLSGGTADLSRVTLDMTGVAPFHQQVLKAARDIPCGTTISYGELARRVGSPGAARAVGRALGQNPFPIIVPCHRVLTSDGRTGGFSASGGAATKLRLLALEGARLV
jgi:methylated-DNA-[protein]-cysteine S-methyltransferase